jgi:hypothetical protein
LERILKKRIRLPTNWQGDFPGRELFDYIQMVTLTDPNLYILDSEHPAPQFIHQVQECFQTMHKKKQLLLPDISSSETICVFSDYGGEHKGSKFHSYSFLVCAHAPDLLQSQMGEIRKRSGRDAPMKEISYKTKNYGPVKRAIPHYLHALDNLVVGGVFTFLVDKTIESLFAPTRQDFAKLTDEVLADVSMLYLQPDVAEKLFRVVHFSAYLVALLSSPKQKVFWMTDHDAIAASQARHADLLKVFQRVLHLYTHNEFALLGGATPFAERDAGYLDLLSVPDLVAGAMEHFFTNKPAGRTSFEVPEAVDHISRWLAHQGVSLKKHNFIFQKKPAGIVTSHISFSLREPDSNAVYIELDF